MWRRAVHGLGRTLLRRSTLDAPPLWVGKDDHHHEYACTSRAPASRTSARLRWIREAIPTRGRGVEARHHLVASLRTLAEGTSRASRRAASAVTSRCLGERQYQRRDRPLPSRRRSCSTSATRPSTFSMPQACRTRRRQSNGYGRGVAARPSSPSHYLDARQADLQICVLRLPIHSFGAPSSAPGDSRA